MTPIARAVRAVLGLFFDDGKLALELLVLLAFSALVANIEVAAPWFSMALLVAGTLIVLFENVVRAARAAKRSGTGPLASDSSGRRSTKNDGVAQMTAGI